MSSDNFNNCLKMLRTSFSDTPQSTPLWVDFYLLRLIATCSESHPDKTLVIRRLDTTHDEVLDIRVVSLCGSSYAHVYRILPHNDFLRHFCGMLAIRMEAINLFRAILEIANVSRKQTLRGVVTDGFKWQVIIIVWDDLFLSGQYDCGVVRSHENITPNDFVVGVLHHWVVHLNDDVGPEDHGYYTTQ
ncbi:hypothetical protein CPB85DRAFT_1566134 [Mucidula mucida]|nr:hypothetical protein CPB85DRAFT_1566134 [Mucidula mucida]